MVKKLPAMQETQVWFLGGEYPWRRGWQPTPVFLPGEFYGQRSLAGYSPWGRRVGHDCIMTLPHLPVLLGFLLYIFRCRRSLLSVLPIFWFFLSTVSLYIAVILVCLWEEVSSSPPTLPPWPLNSASSWWIYLQQELGISVFSFWAERWGDGQLGTVSFFATIPLNSWTQALLATWSRQSRGIFQGSTPPSTHTHKLGTRSMYKLPSERYWDSAEEEDCVT